MLDRLVAPTSIALFGVSRDRTKLGHQIADGLLRGGYAGRVVLVNPRGGEALGRPLVPDAAAYGCDVAMAAVPGTRLPGVLRRCEELSIGLVVSCASGFERRDSPLADEVRTALAETGVRLLGPASIGVYSPAARVNLTTLPDLPARPDGGVYFIAQSGGMAYHVGRRLARLRCGYDVYLNIGAAYDLGAREAVDHAAARPTTGVVLLYLESLAGGDGLLTSIAAAARAKPVVALLGGSTGHGRQATISHTGAMLPPGMRAAALLTDAGALVVETLPQAIAAAAALCGTRPVPVPLPSPAPPAPMPEPTHPYDAGPGSPPRRVFLLADGGGAAVTMADALVRAGLQLTEPSTGTGRVVSELTGGRPGATGNPLELDGLAERDLTVYRRLVDAVVGSGEFDAVVIAGYLGGYARLNGAHLAATERAVAVDLARLARRTPIPIIVQSSFVTDDGDAAQILRDSPLRWVEWAEEAAALLSTPGRGAPGDVSPTASAVRADLTAVHALVMDAFTSAGVDHLLGRRLATAPAPTEGTWVLKLPGLAHKSRLGGIELGVAAAEVPAAHRRLYDVALVNGIAPDVWLSRQVDVQAEVVLTVWRTDEAWTGLTLGTGGTSVELAADTVTGRATANVDELHGMLRRTRFGERFGREPAMLNLLAGVVTVFRHRLPWLAELECNPIVVGQNGTFVADVLGTIQDTRHGRS
ncbi:CoA-binding protein [Micromonospora sp. C95]|uniref:CoA-binding protein n=1 Tax=Micromonospora sp. C95 TaxID=2824882 RepID=UPI001B385AEA|nr:CoA-binding protein [Micromonospora sp. C95]MBQ1026014.1 CoA-binding protein [Micromonospora sp. C95]